LENSYVCLRTPYPGAAPHKPADNTATVS
jgi:hypothetical protein